MISRNRSEWRWCPSMSCSTRPMGIGVLVSLHCAYSRLSTSQAPIGVTWVTSSLRTTLTKPPAAPLESSAEAVPSCGFTCHCSRKIGAPTHRCCNIATGKMSGVSSVTNAQLSVLMSECTCLLTKRRLFTDCLNAAEGSCPISPVTSLVLTISSRFLKVTLLLPSFIERDTLERMGPNPASASGTRPFSKGAYSSSSPTVCSCSVDTVDRVQS
mmetsp:Transcript_31528/g.84152  ORF Transcript_31528/g.84152 Transcript_31528/m.84152 type:complete len:213 (+) Transcript_31528:445-1083(+)